MTGVIKFFLPSKVDAAGRRGGFFGFVSIESPRNGAPLDFFFHGNSVIGDPVCKGDEVDFLLGEDRRGEQVAINVRKLEEI